MTQIKYLSIDEAFTCSSGDTVLDTSINNRISHIHECGGHGKCTTCRIRVLSGSDQLSPRSKAEMDMARKRGWDPTIRLACQAKVLGDIEIQRLIWNYGEVNSIQKEQLNDGPARERAVAILFCDLRNYTKLSSSNMAFDIAYLLNRFYTALGEPILMNNGIIYQYVGDEIIGVFGTAGGSREKNCLHAVRAAISMQYALERLNAVELKDFDIKLKIGIGINFGQAYVGFLGHPTHKQFSVIGDPVNVASRIQGATKKLGAPILISDSTAALIDREEIKLGPTYSVMVKGKHEKLTVHELIGFQQLDLQTELQASLGYLLKDEDQFATIFYKNVFEIAPEARALFTSDMVQQGRLLTHMLGGIVYSLARPQHLDLALRKLGESHVKYGVREEHYPVIKEAMIKTIPEIMQDRYHDRMGKAWRLALDFVTDRMINWDKK